MLKDNDLNEIGKRLYELEADPPKDGWNKIAGTIPEPAGTGVFIKRHWWKGLFLMIPLAMYLAWPEGRPAHVESTLLKKEAPIEKMVVPQLPDLHKENSTAVESSSVSDNSTTSKAKHNEEQLSGAISDDRDLENADKKGARENNSGTESTVQSVGEKFDDDIPQSVAQDQLSEPALLLWNKDDDRAVLIPPQAGTLENESVSTLEIKKAANEPDGKSGTRDTNEFTGKNADELATIKAETDTTGLSGTYNDMANREGIIPAVVLNQSIPQDSNVVALITSHIERDNPGSISDEASEESGTVGALEMHPVNADSIIVSENKPEAHDTTVVADSKKGREEKSTGHWRMTATFSPSFTFKSVQPRPGDEVLVTSINRKSSIPQTIGYGISVGLGREVRNNIFIDAQIAFQTNTEQFSYSYTTGAVDTLIAQKQQDGSVSITPVYAITIAQVKTKLNYGGARIGATYYFWNKPKRRFNISATGGSNFLLSSDVRMNVDGNWVEIENSALNKTTFSFMLSAGYSYRFTGGWELMINPNITYLTGRGNGYQQLSNTNQRSQGLNIMVSKFF
jgi:hypothetical protein